MRDRSRSGLIVGRLSWFCTPLRVPGALIVMEQMLMIPASCIFSVRSCMISRLKLITPVPASGVFPSGWFEAQKGYEPKGAFLDFAIDERSLWQMLGEPDMKSVIWTEHSSEGMRKAMQRLMLREPSELSDGRVPIFICSLCSNLGCGAITAVIESSG